MDGSMVADSASSLRTARLLLVEDDDGDAFLVQELLREASSDYTLIRVSSVAEAFVQLAVGVECVLLDLGLPDAQGLGALREVLSAAGQAAVICLTGLDDERRGADAVAVGAQDYLVKGRVDGQLLHRAVRYAMERRRAQEQARQLYATRLRADENARLERGLLPLPQVRDPDIVVTTRYRPGRGALIGGDFYDVVETEDGSVHVLVGDVAGHGPDEAALGVCLRIAWRALVLSGASSARVLEVVQQVLIGERRSEEVFTTLTVIVIHPDRAHATLWLAGHLAPILLDPHPVTLPTTERGPALGLLPDLTWTGLDVDLPAGWRLVLYTDGLIEGHVGKGSRRLGVPGLLELMAASPALGRVGEMLDDVIARVEGLNSGPMEDDVAVVAIEQRDRGGTPG